MPTQTRVEETINTNKITIVAIGASAGGLEAMIELLSYLPANTGMAYVYIQHLDRTHESNLAAILGRATTMPVTEAVDHVHVEVNRLYIIPPDKEMTLLDGSIKLEDRPVLKEPHLPVSKFFTSLADKYKEAAIGIILSGAANDGTTGLKAIKLAGGLTFVQDETAKFQSMPKSAIAEGAVDLVLSPKEIAEHLTRISKQHNRYYLSLYEGEDVESMNDEEFVRLLVYMYKTIGVDFRQYKVATIRRRIIRRMMLQKFETVKDYLNYIKQNPKEVNLLYQDLLINVTTFFRDEETSEYLKQTLFPSIIKSKTGNEAIRIWIPACSTGQEVYSIAILLFEILGTKVVSTPIQIFATDLSEAAINKARLGVYSKNEITDIPENRLNSFFTRVDGNYRIIKSIKDICIFAVHNIAKDPPFSRVDLISCCNLLIYLDAPLQKKIFNTFHYSLNPNGHLILGKSEAIGSSTNLFSLVEKKLKIYIKKKEGISKASFDVNYNLPKHEEHLVVQNKLLPKTGGKVNLKWKKQLTNCY